MENPITAFTEAFTHPSSVGYTMLAAGAVIAISITVLQGIGWVIGKTHLEHKRDQVAFFSELFPALIFYPGLLYIILVGAAAVAGVIASYSDDILAFAESIFAAPISVIVGMAFFRIRRWSPALYGSVESFLAVVTLIYTVLSPTSTSGNALLAKIIGLLGGIYILVRGLDNIDRGLKQRRRWDQFWRIKPAPPAA